VETRLSRFREFRSNARVALTRLGGASSLGKVRRLLPGEALSPRSNDRQEVAERAVRILLSPVLILVSVSGGLTTGSVTLRAELIKRTARFRKGPRSGAAAWARQTNQPEIQSSPRGDDFRVPTERGATARTVFGGSTGEGRAGGPGLSARGGKERASHRAEGPPLRRFRQGCLGVLPCRKLGQSRATTSLLPRSFGEPGQ
jgi:hypothetical protein